MKEKIAMSTFIPNQVISGKYQNSYTVYIKSDEDSLSLSYIAYLNRGKREYSFSMPKFIAKDNETFEVLGLLQAEMGKKDIGCLSFSNCEYKLINKVVRWFDKEFVLQPSAWSWRITVNINEPEDVNYKKEIETKVINHWLSKTKVDEVGKNPKTVIYIKNTKNKRLKFSDYGTLQIAYKSNLFSQIIKRFVSIIFQNIPHLEDDCIRSFIKGVIAGEGCVVYHKESKHYNVRISACKKEERDIYQACLNKLGIEIKQYEDYKEMVISKRENLVKLLEQRLMTLSPSKYSKFFSMMQQYKDIKEETQYFKPKSQNV